MEEERIVLLPKKLNLSGGEIKHMMLLLKAEMVEQKKCGSC
jgi:hypothetical protein